MTIPYPVIQGEDLRQLEVVPGVEHPGGCVRVECEHEAPRPDREPGRDRVHVSGNTISGVIILYPVHVSDPV